MSERCECVMVKTGTATNVDIVVYALATLGGAKRTIHTEDITAKCYELAAGRFSWSLPKYREKGWPDQEKVRPRLIDARTAKLVGGSHSAQLAKDGWWLTPKGLAWFKRNAARIEKELTLAKSGPSMSEHEKGIFLRRMRAQPLFKKFSKTAKLEGTSQYHFTDMLDCSPDVSRDIVRRKFDRFHSQAEFAGDKDVIRFLEACGTAFSQVLGDLDVHGRPGEGEAK